MVMKIETKFINISKTVEFLGPDFAAKLHQIHTVTVCDTTSFLHTVGKIKVIKSQWKRKALRLLNTTGVSCKVWDTAVKDVKVLKSLFELFATLENKKSLTEIRVWLYKQIKTKNFSVFTTRWKANVANC